MTNIINTKVVRCLFFLLVFTFSFSVLLDPTDSILGLKKLSFVALIGYILLDLTLTKKILISKRSVFYLTVFMAFCLWGSLLAYISYRDGVVYSYSFTFAYILSFLFLFLLPFYSMQRYSKLFINAIILSGFLLSLVTICTWFFYTFIPTDPLFHRFMIYMNYDSKSAMITTRQYGIFQLVMVYFKSIVLLFPLLALAMRSVENKRINVILIFCFLFAIILSGSRTNILLAILMIVAVLYDSSSVFTRRYILYCVGCIAPFAVFEVVSLISANADISVDIKSGDFWGYLEIFSNDLSYIWIGDGFGAYFLAAGKYEVVPLTELVYMDLIRWFGFLPAIFFLLFLISPVYYFLKAKDFIFLGSYACYLLVMGTNPLFVSSTGMLAMIIYFGRVIEIQNRTH